MELIRSWRQRARLLETDIYALYLAYKDPRVPLYAKIFLLALIGYVYSPLDFIPDFIPGIGYLDDLLVLSVGVPISIKMVPPEVLAEYRAKARTEMDGGKLNGRRATAILIAILVLLATLALVILTGRPGN